MSVGVDTTTSSGPSLDDVVHNKLAVAYAESSQFHETNKELMTIREHAIMKSEENIQYSTNFLWQVCVHVHACMCVCVCLCKCMATT